MGLRRAAACARYLILAEKARALPRRTPRSRPRSRVAMVDRLARADARPTVTADAIADAARGPLDVDALAAQGYGHERLDQLVTELLLGVR